MILKSKARSDYMKKRIQHDKDLYTVRRRSTQWVYDHLVFPFVCIFSMIAFFCTILELQSIVVNETAEVSSNEGFFGFV
jgi:hypothetical protein